MLMQVVIAVFMKMHQLDWVNDMFVAIYFALVVTYGIYTICECGWKRTDKKVMAGLLVMTAMMYIWELFA